MQMKNYEDKRIFKQLAWARNFYVINTILTIFSFLGMLILSIIGIVEVHFYGIIYLFTSIMGCQISTVKPLGEKLTKNQMEDINDRNIETIMWNPEIKLLLWLIYDGVLPFILIFIFTYLNFPLMLKLTNSAFFWPNFFASISCFRAYLYIRRENKKNPPDYVIQEKQRKLLQEKEKNSQTAANLILKTGKLFFVKYYIYLQNYSESDLMDIVKENYSEEIKTQKIRAGKEIFRLGLHKNALQQIVSDTNGSVDERTKDMAKKLLNK